MLIDAHLKDELMTVPGLSNNVFPLFAPKDHRAPYLVFQKENLSFKKTLGGTSSKAEATFNMAVLHKGYPELLELSEAVVNKLLSFQSRTIGTNGPFIENITVSLIGDNYDPDVDMVRSNIHIKVNY